MKPKALREGSTVGLAAPAGAVRVEDGLARSAEALRRMGYRVVIGKSCARQYGYLAGTDEVRAKDLTDLFLDPAIDAVFCLRGGYGSPRILDRLDYAAIAAHPKLFLGYSDVSALHAAFHMLCGFPTLHGPMPASDLIAEDFSAFSKKALERALTLSKPLGALENPPGEPLRTLVGGRARGVLCGGNLTLIASLLGTRYELDTRGKILFLEDVGEKTYRIDNMLNHLRLCGKFRDCAGVVLGDFTDCPIEYEDFGLSLEQIFADLIAPAGKPTVLNLKAGHGRDKLTLPLGVTCELDADTCTLTAVEAALDD